MQSLFQNNGYWSLFTNHPILWTAIVILLIAMFVLNKLIERRDKENIKKEQKEKVREKAMEELKKNSRPNVKSREDSVEDPVGSSSRWTLNEEDSSK